MSYLHLFNNRIQENSIRKIFCCEDMVTESVSLENISAKLYVCRDQPFHN